MIQNQNHRRHSHHDGFQVKLAHIHYFPLIERVDNLRLDCRFVSEIWSVVHVDLALFEVDMLSSGGTLMFMHHPKCMSEFMEDGPTILLVGYWIVLQPAQVECGLIFANLVGTFADGAPRRSRLEGDANMGLLRVLPIFEDDVSVMLPCTIDGGTSIGDRTHGIFSLLTPSNGFDETIFDDLERRMRIYNAIAITTNPPVGGRVEVSRIESPRVFGHDGMTLRFVFCSILLRFVNV